jgi:hypothetical protein
VFQRLDTLVVSPRKGKPKMGEDHTHTSALKGVSPGSSQMHDAFNEELSNGRLTMTRVSRSIRPQKTGRRAGCTREQQTPSPSMTRLPTVKSALFLPHTRATHRVSPLAFLCAHERVVLVVAATAPFFGCSSCQNCRCRTECTGIAFNSR